MSTSVVFVKKSILESVPQAWEEEWKQDDPQSAPHESDFDEPRIIPVSKQRPLPKFGIPVTRETSSLVHTHVLGLYKEARSLKEAHRTAKQESTGTQQEKLSMSQKIDPAVLWVFTTTGCRHRVFQTIFREPGDGVFSDSRQGWCCDGCAYRRGFHVETVVAPGITLGNSVSYLRTDPSNKIILLSKPREVVPHNPNEPRREIISSERKKSLQKDLENWRRMKLKELKLQHAVPSIVLPDQVLSRIVKNVRHIVTFPQLLATLRDAHWDLKSSLLSEIDLVGVFAWIEESLKVS